MKPIYFALGIIILSMIGVYNDATAPKNIAASNPQPNIAITQKTALTSDL